MDWNLVIAGIPTLLLIFEKLSMAGRLSEFRKENRELFENWGERIRELEVETSKLKEFKHNANNRLQILVAHVDDLRVRKN